MTLQSKVAFTSREQFMQFVQDELNKFESAERELRKSTKKDRVRELKLPEELANQGNSERCNPRRDQES